MMRRRGYGRAEIELINALDAQEPFEEVMKKKWIISIFAEEPLNFELCPVRNIFLTIAVTDHSELFHFECSPYKIYEKELKS